MEILSMRNSSEIAYMQIVIQNKKLQLQFWVSSIFNVPVKIRMVFVTVIIGINWGTRLDVWLFLQYPNCEASAFMNDAVWW